ncbi:unnamed protein product [Arctogadus glacialis]
MLSIVTSTQGAVDRLGGQLVGVTGVTRPDLRWQGEAPAAYRPDRTVCEDSNREAKAERPRCIDVDKLTLSAYCGLSLRRRLPGSGLAESGVTHTGPLSPDQDDEP